MSTKRVGQPCRRMSECAYRGRCLLSEIYALRQVNLSNFIDSRSQVLFQAFELMRVLISRLANLWLHRKVSYSTVCLTGRYSAHSRNLGGWCFKRYKQKMEGAGNAEVMFFLRRVLLETFDEKRFLHF